MRSRTLLSVATLIVLVLSPVQAGFEQETVDIESAGVDATSIALDNHDRPHIAYYAASLGELRYAKGLSETWSIEVD